MKVGRTPVEGPPMAEVGCGYLDAITCLGG